MLILFRRWIAGPNVDDAIQRAIFLKKKGVRAIINRLGEHNVRWADIEDAYDSYKELISLIKKSKTSADISVKLSQFDVRYEKERCFALTRNIVRDASRAGIFVWIDMESLEHVDETLGIYKKILKFHKNVGIVIQARLKRSVHDTQELMKLKASIRLVKGAYKENHTKAYTTESEIRENYIDILESLFHSKCRVAVATHDMEIIKYAEHAMLKHKKPVEFQMLMGVKNTTQEKLAQQGYKVAEYVPYGKSWRKYVARRLRERRH